MAKRKDTNKTERLYSRVEETLKSDLHTFLSTKQESTSDFIRSLIKQAIYPPSHEELIENILDENKFYNDLMTNPELPNKSKQIISKELKKHV